MYTNGTRRSIGALPRAGRSRCGSGVAAAATRYDPAREVTMKTMGPDEFLALLEKRLGRPIPVPPPTSEHDDCPICRALGMTDGPREGVSELDGMQILTVMRPGRARR
jgi:hypothetical protein